MSNKSKWIKAIGVAATVIGVGVNLITDWVNRKWTRKLKKRSVKHLPGETKMKRRSPNKALSLFLLEETNGIAD